MARLRKGASVRIDAKFYPDGAPWPKRLREGTVVQVRRHKALILFPVRSYSWIAIELLRVVAEST